MNPPHLLYLCGMRLIIVVHVMHLYNIWSNDKKMNQNHFKPLSVCFQQYMNGHTTFEIARDTFRHEIHSESCTISLWNQRHQCDSSGISNSCPSWLCSYFKSWNINCEYSEPPINGRLGFMLYERNDMPKSTCKWLNKIYRTWNPWKMSILLFCNDAAYKFQVSSKCASLWN